MLMTSVHFPVIAPCRWTLLWALAALALAGCTVDFTNTSQVCGNGIIDADETCDDGNLVTGDGCDDECVGEEGWQCYGQPSLCTTRCGDGLTAGLEECDDGNGVPADGCTPGCLVEPGWFCVGTPSDCAPICGDGVLAGPEPCDGDVLGVPTCADLQLGSGTLTCLLDCTYDLSDCEIQAECGNGVVEYPEVCDGTELRDETCQTQGFFAGELACQLGCGGFDVSGCSGYCGDGILQAGEACDGEELGGNTCEGLGFTGGVLACRNDCGAFDTAQCTGGTCGDGMVSGGEACDGNNLQGLTCQSFSYYGGTLDCFYDCTQYDTTGCSGLCGDGTVNGPEVCDGGDLGGATCQSLGFDSGTLGCQLTCGGYDTSGCSHDCEGACGSPQCEGQPCGPHGLVCSGSDCVCSGNGGAVQTTESDCDDGADNDCNGVADCADGQCTNASCGPHGRVCTGGVCACSGNGGAAQANESACDDGVDNDCDGDADCVDSQCNSQACGPHGQVCSSNTCVCSGNGGTAQSAESDCSDGSDNDCDGNADCADSQCDGSICGAYGQLCTAGSCICPGGNAEGSTDPGECDDNIDNDCDGQIDCLDSHCYGVECGPDGLVCESSGSGQCVCGGGGGTVETAESICDDGADNDCDGNTDCADVKCDGESCGPGQATCTGGACIGALTCNAGESHVTVTSNDVPKTIADQSSTSSVLNVITSGTERVKHVRVTLDITHSYDDDLDIHIECPDATMVELSTDNGSSGQDYTATSFDDDCQSVNGPISAGTAPFSGCYSPEGTLGDFDNAPAAGTWTLHVADDQTGDTGTLNGWTLELCIE